MAGRTGYTAVSNSKAPNFGGDLTAVYQFFDPLIGESRSTRTALPSSGNWIGRTIALEDSDTQVRWNGSVWRTVSDYAAPVQVTYATGGFSNYVADGWNGTFLTRVNGVVFVSGAFARASWGAGQSVFTIPAGYRPPHQFEIAGDPYKMVARANGEFLLKAAGTGGSSFTGSWPAAS